jgi:NAD(P)-dependent dehydrogenase (short-subunit alcohol dehydrogenase family)
LTAEVPISIPRNMRRFSMPDRYGSGRLLETAAGVHHVPAERKAELTTMTRKTPLVTGANRGLGWETCRQLASDGFSVILTARRDDDGADAVHRLAAAGLSAVFRPLDVTNDASVAALAAALTAEQVRLDLLVITAAIALDGFNAEVALRTINANFFGPMRVTDALLPRMRDGATIVMVSSGAGGLSAFSKPLQAQLTDPQLTRASLIGLMNGFVEAVADGSYKTAGWPGSAYATSKAGLNALVRVMAPELARRSIRVNAVCPGWVRTDMGGRHATRSIDHGAASIVWAARLGEDGPTGGFFRDGKAIAW